MARRTTKKGIRIPYIAHPPAVAGIVFEYGGSEDKAIAALLHVVIDDQGVTAPVRHAGID